jgi:diadenosine tetraphosphate (Ap4A) HIT family hydrolase
MGCLVCERIEMIKQDTNPYFVIELETGYVVMGDHQHFKGYTLFLCKQHVTELHHLPQDFKLKHLEEMSIVAEAVCNVFKPEKMNYELLGNEDVHAYWHLFPRVTGDTPQKGPVWWLPREEMWDDSKRPKDTELKIMIDKLRTEVIRLLTKLE